MTQTPTQSRPSLAHDEVPIIDIDALAKPIARLRIFGSEHDLLPINGASFALYVQLAERKDDPLLALDLLREIVASSVPSLSQEHRAKLTHEQLTAICMQGMQRLDEVTSAITASEKNDSAPPANSTPTADPSDAPMTETPSTLPPSTTSPPLRSSVSRATRRAAS